MPTTPLDISNVLDGKPIATRLKIQRCKHEKAVWVDCLVTKVYYKDVHHKRLVWVDVEVLQSDDTEEQARILAATDGQVFFSRTAMENTDHKFYPKIMAAMFQQEQVDTAYKQHLQDRYTCYVELHLDQLYTSQDGYWWQGTAAICTYPQYGHVFLRQEQAAHFSYVCITPALPLVLQVKDAGKVRAESRVFIRMGNGGIPDVEVYGNVIFVVPHINGHLYSGRQRKLPVAVPAKRRMLQKVK